MCVDEHREHLVKLLTFVCKRNDIINQTKACPPAMTVFHEGCPKDLDWDKKLQALVACLDESIRCSASCFAVALVYIDRVTALSQDCLTLNRYTVFRLFSTSLLVAHQFLDDTSERVSQFAAVCGYPSSLMARLKLEFVFRLQFHLLVDESEVLGYASRLKGKLGAAGFHKQGLMWYQFSHHNQNCSNNLDQLQSQNPDPSRSRSHSQPVGAPPPPQQLSLPPIRPTASTAIMRHTKTATTTTTTTTTRILRRQRSCVFPLAQSVSSVPQATKMRSSKHSHLLSCINQYGLVVLPKTFKPNS